MCNCRETREECPAKFSHTLLFWTNANKAANTIAVFPLSTLFTCEVVIIIGGVDFLSSDLVDYISA